MHFENSGTSEEQTQHLPLVSVAIPSFNHAAFVERCLESVVKQTYSELELVLIDDGSTDGTFDLAQRYIEPYRERFRRVVFEQRANQGVSANSNACIKACRGEWVHLLGSDDVLAPTKVEVVQAFISSCSREDLVMVHADCALIDESGKRLIRSRQKPSPPAGLEFKAYEWLFRGAHYIFNPTVTLHRRKFLASGGFDQSLPLEDLDCWLRLSEKYVFARVPEVLAFYRKHPGNSSRRRIVMLSALFKTYAKFLERNPTLIAAEVLRDHYRANLGRVWRRARTKAPRLLPSVLFALCQSYWRTPNAADYTRFGMMLDQVASAKP